MWRHVEDLIFASVNADNANDEGKVQSNYKLTRECRRLLKLLSKKYGLHEAGVIEVMTRDMAVRAGVAQAAGPFPLTIAEPDEEAEE